MRNKGGRNNGIGSMSKTQKAKYLQSTVDGLKKSDKTVRCVASNCNKQSRGSTTIAATRANTPSLLRSLSVLEFHFNAPLPPLLSLPLFSLSLPCLRIPTPAPLTSFLLLFNQTRLGDAFA